MPNRSTRSLRLLGVMLLVLLGSAMLVPPAQPARGAPAVPAFAIFAPLVVNNSSAAAAAPAPPPTTSYYLTTTNPSELKLLGCAAAVEMQQKNIADGVVILFLGRPAYQKPASFFETGIYGTRLLDTIEFTSIDSTNTGLQSWIDGFITGYHPSNSSQYECGLSANTSSRPVITLAVATTNQSVQMFSSSNIAVPDGTLAEHGAAWGTLINSLRDYTVGRRYQQQITVYGASNIERDFNTPSETKKWVAGYNSATTYHYFNIADCSGCPDPDNEWTPVTMWEVSTGANAPIIPQIYRTDGNQAIQWRQLAQKVLVTIRPNANDPTETLSALVFAGTLTQHQACDDRGGDQPTPQTGQQYCTVSGSSTYNTAAAGWSQFSTELAGANLLRLYQTGNSYQALPWSSDVRWNRDFSQFKK